MPSPGSRRPFRCLKNTGLYLLVLATAGLARAAPRRAGLAVFSALGRLIFRLAAGERRRTIDNLRLVFGEAWGEETIHAVARGVFAGLGRNFFDAVRLPGMPPGRLELLVHHDPFDEFDAAFRRGRGVIAVTGHIGCFELLLHFFSLKGYPCFAVGRRMFDPRIDRLVARLRSGQRREYLYTDRGGSAVLRFLKQGKVMGVLLDQDVGFEGVYAHFLGRIAYTSCGIVKIAMKYGIPIFVVTTSRSGDDRHFIRIHGEVELSDTGDRTRDLVANVEAINERLGSAVMAAPEQWVWMHRRWRHQPHKGDGIPNIEDFGPIS